ncbi:bifunctional N-acetylglucosamine-1-phosphate uridyltransferase/glucosamine-1-phosphate acetyltransferase [candidate division WOR-3 bacterium]|nr:bifunctional N-acetylglucosamine-1-phosphate uridyltransferase/glucosamine-1-phosphate acetyltransferase [candidate division WOR-3 bacterium]
MDGLGIVILAAGEGKRMKSTLPKALHRVAGYPMLGYVLDTAEKLQPQKIVAVVGKGGESVMEYFSGRNISFVLQDPPLGTGHAVLQAKEALNGISKTLILYGDVPLIRHETLVDFLSESEKSAISVLGMVLEEPKSYGRLITKGGCLLAIRESRDANEEEKKIKKVNTGIMICRTEILFNALLKIKPDNDQKEYYLTDVVSVLNSEGEKVCFWTAENASEFQGANDREELSFLSEYVRREKMRNLMKAGVSIISPQNTVIDYEVQIGEDSVIHPFNYISGKTKIGQKCTLKPFHFLENAKMEDGEIL